MQITYRGEPAECREGESAGGFLAAKGVDAKKCVVDLDGEILPPGAADGAALREGSKLDAFQIVPGG